MRRSIIDSPPLKEHHETAEGRSGDRIDTAIFTYQSALEAIPTKATEDTKLAIARVLFARDAAARALSESQLVDPVILDRLTTLDQQLKDKAAKIEEIVGRETFLKWRETVRASATDWWWSLEERGTAIPSPIWTILSVLLVVASTTLTAEISRRFLINGGADLTAISVPLIQAVLTFFSGATLTQTGQEWIERILSSRNVARKRFPILKAAIPLAILLLIAGVYGSLPFFARRYARLYSNQAFELHATGKLDRAMKSYERAISLDPEFAPPHYNLGDAYEVLGDFDKAITEYQVALRIDPRFYLAYNNLARLLLLRRSDPSTALRLLNTALDLNPQEPIVKYSLYKNRGWAYLNLKNYNLAAADLCEALSQREDGAAAYCLLAQVLEARMGSGKEELCKYYKDGEINAWELCEAFGASQEHEIEAGWLSLAQERLKIEQVK